MSKTQMTFIVLAFLPNSMGADWNQWRGPNRDGFAPNSPPMIHRLPANGLRPVWISEAPIPSAQSGGWSSPVVADGKVYLFVHGRKKLASNELLKPKFPYLAPDKRTEMSDDEYAEYERKRRDEQQARSKSYRFDESLYCLDATTGKTRWKNDQTSIYTRFPQSGSPTIIDGRAYVLAAGRRVRCIDATNGKSIWETRLPGEFRDEFLQASIAVADKTVVAMCGRLFGLDVNDGKLLWQRSEADSQGDHSSPIVWNSARGKLVIVNLSRGFTSCVEPRTGEERWRVKSEAGRSSPILSGDRLITYGSSRKKGLRCFRIDPDNAEHVWTYQGAADSGSSPVAVNGYVYVQGDRRIACVDVNSGKAAWSAMLDLNRPRYTSLAAADGKVFYAFDGLLCFRAQPDNFNVLFQGKIDDKGILAGEQDFRRLLGIGKLETTAEGQKDAERLWRKKFGTSGPLPCASPAIADGRIYLRLRKGIACYDLRETKGLR